MEAKFNAAVEIIQKLPKTGPLQTSNDDKLKFYSLFKQATIGDVNTERPSFFSPVERAKWDAWEKVKGLSKEEAMKQYVETVIEVFDKAAKELDIDAWLAGPDLDPIIKENLAKINA
ncbi:hypothetical protein PMAYCL1PPCAC_00037 [Pristionchus mayeri]|uniref:ACB domain-containing protein n=1 Tax=Pristionchus mayeri TaxID=1317129 RepID=A0AAN4YVL7_9BILA|nr:hypothetical protein PMAYCL1PPCAC_00037 [Pristionchus mayeri]